MHVIHRNFRRESETQEKKRATRVATMANNSFLAPASNLKPETSTPNPPPNPQPPKQRPHDGNDSDMRDGSRRRISHPTDQTAGRPAIKMQCPVRARPGALQDIERAVHALSESEGHRRRLPPVNLCPEANSKVQPHSLATPRRNILDCSGRSPPSDANKAID